MAFIFGTVLTVLAVFLILLVLVQRGRGGGLTGALGGMGGSSAFGAKAGDVFTRITIVAAAIWICTCVAAGYWGNHRGDRLGATTMPRSSSSETAPAGPGLAAPAATEEKAAPEGAGESPAPAANAPATPSAPPLSAPAESK